MLSPSDMERLITVKRREIVQEKILLGLTHTSADVKLEDVEDTVPNLRRVQFADKLASNAETEAKEERDRNAEQEPHKDLDERIPPDLERYIRRYLGLPVMLKAGEYSPNNPLIRAERTSGDVLLGLGEYERRRNTLRKLRQQQYREYLDQQAKKKQEEKERADRERREREEKEREREERERERERERELLEREKNSPRRASAGCGGSVPYYTKKVDTGVQVDSIHSPLSVAVQTDDADLFQLRSPTRSQRTEAERELSPRAGCDVWIKPRTIIAETLSTSRRPIFDVEAIHMRNLQAEKEAAERRQYYQQELKNQIMEQQRIREERKTREKMLEKAEMRRLEEQLRMLKLAQEREVGKQREITAAINAENLEYIKKRTELQKEIDSEKQSLLRAPTSHSDSYSQLPLYYPRVKQKDKPYSTNIPDNSIFSSNYDVDSYLRKNLNFKNTNRFHPKKDVFGDKNKDFNYDDNFFLDAKNVDKNSDGQRSNAKKDIFDDKIFDASKKFDFEDENGKNNLDLRIDDYKDKKVIVEKAIVHEPRERMLPKLKSIENDDTPIPVLRHSPVSQRDKIENDLSDAMKVVDDKWKVPAVQKNILRSLPNEEGKNINILTQLGSIRRQLQLEQLKLDRMGKGDA
ncbi:RNA-binding protein 25-like isoform X2 [Plodia interpunctella]|uniref:RNA-binding protein 25-like isoform X2 n=1 Tax=Plodia interpunctella TaxID=58824 RepID=UPI00236777CA|nr:RNA-binding protein 25-like isoform X2 [Plodia interpunctella]